MVRILVLAGMFLLVSEALGFADLGDKALGYWKSVSDEKGEEGKITAIWKLSLNARGLLEGEIVWTPDWSASETYTCTKKEFSELPLQGTKWMKGLRKAGNDSWKNGTIVNLSTPAGDVYGCDVRVIAGGNKLSVRGYIGISLLGRSQIWLSVQEDEVNKLKASQPK